MKLTGKILVTGAHGFIGHGLTEELQREYGQENVLIPSSKELDLLNGDSVEEYFSRHAIQVVYHLAARHAGVGSGISQELMFLETNLMMNYNIVAVSRRQGVEKFITFGSSCSYQRHLDHPAREEDLWCQHAENTYGTCKLMMLEHLQTQTDMPWAYLVPSNFYGPGDHFGETGTHFVPATVQKFQTAVKQGSDHIVIWGDGLQTRDFLYLSDAVRVLTDALRTDKFDGRPVNFATGEQSSILCVTELIRHELGLNHIEIRCDATKPVGLRSREMDNSLFLKLDPGYRFVGIEEGIRRTMAWYLSTVKAERS